MSHDRQMGDAESTVAANKAATRLFNVWRDRNGRSPLSNMQWVEVEEDNLEAEIFNFCRWVSSTPIPKFFDDQLKPRLNNSNQEGTVKLLLKSTLTKYVGKVILMIRNKFPQQAFVVTVMCLYGGLSCAQFLSVSATAITCG